MSPRTSIRIMLPWALALHLLAPVAADDLQLAGDERLTGTVTAIRPDGAVLVRTAFAAEPLALKADAVRRVVFGEVPGQPVSAPALLHLRNGDSLAGTVEAVTEQAVVFSTGSSGRHEIPRAMVAGVEQGGTPARVLYPGADGTGSWRDDGEGWEHNGGVLTIRGRGITGRKMAALPEGFIIGFKLSWTGQPNLRFSFAGDDFLENGSQDRYYFEFTSSGGVNITRETTSGESHYINLARVKRLPAQYDDRQVLVELRVDRTRREIQLLLDGESEGRFRDPAPAAPPGAWIAFKSSAARDGTTTISNLTVTSWDGRSTRPAPVRSVAGEGDTLTGVDGERFTGTLGGAARVGGSLLYRFRCANSQEMMEVPESAVAALTLAPPAGPGPADAAPSFRILLNGGGLLGVRSAEFTGDSVAVEHPLLGKLTFKRAAIKAFERAVAEKKPTKPKS